jgi:hypothetical protein
MTPAPTARKAGTLPEMEEDSVIGLGWASDAG